MQTQVRQSYARICTFLAIKTYNQSGLAANLDARAVKLQILNYGEFPFVILCGITFPKVDLEQNRKLAYVGMTRATERLAVVSRKDHALAQDLERSSNLMPSQLFHRQNRVCINIILRIGAATNSSANARIHFVSLPSLR